MVQFIQPSIWRRVLVPDSMTLAQLHQVIQLAMGWDNRHLYSFRIGDRGFAKKSDTDDGYDLELEDDAEVLLRDVLQPKPDVVLYEYDFGDSWLHEIILEETLPRDSEIQYPVCLDGARACPPEDCGGEPGYLGILKAVQAKRKTPEQKHLLEWLGGEYAPEHFDLDQANWRLKAVQRPL